MYGPVFTLRCTGDDSFVTGPFFTFRCTGDVSFANAAVFTLRFDLVFLPILVAYIMLGVPPCASLTYMHFYLYRDCSL